MKPILCVGMVCEDTVVKVEKFPEEDSDQRLKNRTLQPWTFQPRSFQILYSPVICLLLSVWLWNFKDGWSLNIKFFAMNQHTQRNLF